jgi:hypothetical protein
LRNTHAVTDKQEYIFGGLSFIEAGLGCIRLNGENSHEYHAHKERNRQKNKTLIRAHKNSPFIGSQL